MSNNNPRLEEESKYNDKISGLLKRINDLEKKQERGAFTLVLVDGDGMTVSRPALSSPHHDEQLLTK